MASETRSQIEEYLQSGQMRSLLAEHSAIRARDYKQGAIQLIAQVHTDWAHRRRITQPEPNGVRPVIQFVRAVVHAKRRIEAPGNLSRVSGLESRRRRKPPQGHVRELAVGIPAVIEKRSAQPFSSEWDFQGKAQFLV